jgi:hypothetical protein
MLCSRKSYSCVCVGVGGKEVHVFACIYMQVCNTVLFIFELGEFWLIMQLTLFY